MPLPLFQIARLTNAGTGATDGAQTYSFFDLTGPVPPRQRSVEVITFPGVDNYALRRGATRGRSFTLQSLSYANTLADAWAFLETVQSLTEDPLGVRLWQADVSTWPYDVLAVDRLEEPSYEKVASVRIAEGVYARVSLSWRLIGRST